MVCSHEDRDNVMGSSVEKPPVASYSWARTLLLASGLSALFIFLIWLFTSATWWAQGNRSVPPLSLVQVLLGSVPLPLGLYSRWAWRPRRKHAHWHRWGVRLLGSLWLSALLLLAAALYWNFVVRPPWNRVVDVLLGVAFVLAWALPVLSHSLAKRLLKAQADLDLRLIAVSRGAPIALMVVAGILAAGHALSGGDGPVVLMAVLSSVLCVGLAQYWAAHLWPLRPWAREEEP